MTHASMCYSERAGAAHRRILVVHSHFAHTAYDAKLWMKCVLSVAPSYQPNLAVTLGGAPSFHIWYDACHSSVYSRRKWIIILGMSFSEIARSPSAVAGRGT